MIIWINGCFGVGKTSVANALCDMLPKAHIYDPEQVGFFLWDNFPDGMKRQGDFQDIPLWRTVNYDMIKYLCENYGGDLIIPMTLVNKSYYREIIERLENGGVCVKHFILNAPKDIIRERLLERGDGENSWAEQQIDRCGKAFDGEIPGIGIDTGSASVEEVANMILRRLSENIE